MIREQAIANSRKRMADQRKSFSEEGVRKAIEVAKGMLIALAQLNKEQKEMVDQLEEGQPLPPNFVLLDKRDRIKKIVEDVGSAFGSSGNYGNQVIEFGVAMFRSELGFQAADSKKRKIQALKHEEDRQKLASTGKKNQLTFSFA